MKINRRIFAGMAVLALLFGLVLTGCSTTKFTWKETETSKAIYQAASEMLLSKGGKITAGELISGLSNKFPGLKGGALAIQIDLIQVTYGGTAMWPTTYKIECTMPDEVEKQNQRREERTGGGVSVNTIGNDAIVTSIVSVQESVKVEP